MSAPVARDAAVQVFQIYYRDDQLQHLDPAFLPFDNRGVQDEWLEFGVFLRLSRLSVLQSLRHWGAVSWRFGEKTSLTGRALLDAVAAEPTVDVFYLNPYPEHEGLFQSSWVQGAVSHPGLLGLAQQVLSAGGLDPLEILRVAPASDFSAANYFVGNETFWSLYLPFVQTLIKRADQRMAPQWQRMLHSREADVRGLHQGATFLPFVVERLLPVFLRTAGQALTVRKIKVPAKEALLNLDLQYLRSLKDTALEHQNPQLLGAWQRYRDLYLERITKPQWRALHAKALSSGFQDRAPAC